MTALIPVAQTDFESKVLNADKPVLVEFGAEWCGPCRLLEPVLEELAAEYGDRVDFYTVDVDQSPHLATQHAVMGVPTVMLFREGKLLERMTGFRPRKALEKLFLAKL